MKLKSFTTLDIVLMALLAVANGVMTTYTSFVNKLLTAAGGPIATSTIVGVYMIYGVLAIYIIRKPGAAFATFLIGATVQSMIGTSYGMASAYVAALCYAFAVEAVFALYRYKRWDVRAVMLASVAAVPLWFVFAAYMFGYWKWGLPVLAGALVVRCLSGLLLCGLVTTWLGDALARAGLLKSFAISRRHAE
ncbi:ECF transporter S component [Paenibacillus sp.]|uniref:ECF transporter S component n=1 Tax=Paenibacillus sp. TaxID=58172 RepID=UPI002D2E2B36|nr:ECF transporter S component [Paenibacillus sp.]HZG55359.1 ECF transporter S component [Paenibacillus sp.]